MWCGCQGFLALEGELTLIVNVVTRCGCQGFLALEGELTPILVQMVKSANMNGLLDNDNESSKYQNM